MQHAVLRIRSTIVESPGRTVDEANPKRKARMTRFSIFEAVRERERSSAECGTPSPAVDRLVEDRSHGALGGGERTLDVAGRDG